MPSKSFLAISAAAVAIAMAPGAAAAPAASNVQAQCQSLGKGGFGYNSSDITIYTDTPPAVYLTVAEDGSKRIVASHKPTYENATMFEFFSCLHTPANSNGKGAIDTYQGYIKAPNGECVTLTSLTNPTTHVETQPCKFNGVSAIGNVAHDQHFQFQTDTFYNYYSAVFLGNTHGPVSADSNKNSFGGGGHRVFNLDPPPSSDPYDYTSYLKSTKISGDAQKPDPSKMLIGQLGDQYKPTLKTFPECKLVKQGAVELFNHETGETQSVTATYPSQFEYGYSIVVNGTGNPSFPTFSFYQCDSTYMGYTSDANNHYGHFSIDAADQSNCFVKQTGGSTNNLILENPGTYISADSPCGTADTNTQVSSFFHLVQSDGHYSINYLGAPISEHTGQYGWAPQSDPSAKPGAPTTVVVNNDGSDYQYRLRFVN